MAATCLAITSVTSTLAEHLHVIAELRLYQTCSCIHTGNKEHLKVLANLRSWTWSRETPRVPPFYQVCQATRLEQLYDRWPHLRKLCADEWFKLDHARIYILDNAKNAKPCHQTLQRLAFSIRAASCVELWASRRGVGTIMCIVLAVAPLHCFSSFPRQGPGGGATSPA